MPGLDTAKPGTLLAVASGMRTSSRPGPSLRRAPALLVLALVLAPLPGAFAFAAGDVRAPESTLKAAYLYQLVNFVDWPEDGGDRPLRLCILGEDPFGAAIDVIAGKEVRGRPLALERLASAEGMESCHLLFISASEAGELGGILDHLAGASVLTVGDSKDFAESGGMVGFVVKADKLRLEVNLGAVQEAGLKISAKLLELSQIVKNRKKGMGSRPLGGRGGEQPP